jgi:hypothetical protein
MRTKHHIVIWHFSGRVRINNKTHREPTYASAQRLQRLLSQDTYYTVMTHAAMIHHVRR